MCEPTSITMIGLAISAASTAASYKASQDQADAQADNEARKMEFSNKSHAESVQHQRRQRMAQQAQYNEFGDASVKDAKQLYQSTLQQSDQIRATGFANLQNVMLQTMDANATTRVGAAEGMVGGRSLEDALNEFEKVESAAIVTTADNLEHQGLQTYKNMLGIQARAQGQANSAILQPMAPVNAPAPGATVVGPSPLAYILQFGSQALGAMNSSGMLDPDPTPTATAPVIPASTYGLSGGYTAQGMGPLNVWQGSMYPQYQ